MAASSAFSLIEEFYFFAAIAATSLLDHLVRCSFLHLLRLDLDPQAKIHSVVFSCCFCQNIDALQYLHGIEIQSQIIIYLKISRKYKSSRSSLKEECSE